jgi:hypothetical protein
MCEPGVVAAVVQATRAAQIKALTAPTTASLRSCMPSAGLPSTLAPWGPGSIGGCVESVAGDAVCRLRPEALRQ